MFNMHIMSNRIESHQIRSDHINQSIYLYKGNVSIYIKYIQDHSSVYIYIYTELLGFVSSSWPTAGQRNGSLGQLSGQSLEPCGSMAVETPRESAPHLAVHSANRPSKTRSGRANSCHESFNLSFEKSKASSKRPGMEGLHGHE